MRPDNHPTGADSDNPAQRIHLRITVEGIVQGVGFRPFVHRLATELDLAGQVHNFTGGVEVDVEGPPRACHSFAERLVSDAPPIAVIEHSEVEQLPLAGLTGFTITPSRSIDEGVIYVSPEVATCEDCLRELADPNDRRYLHPFINCTNCGPRYTIIASMPYDRPATSMAPFPMCPDCDREYHDIADRRYHAQPVACPACGPRLWVQVGAERIEGHDAITTAQDILAEGGIVAIKGLGGFHLACDATNDAAVAELRTRKHREEKPLAVMVPDVETARELAEFSDAALELLQSVRTPIVLARKSEPERLAHFVAPDSADYGIMLPYTPVHHLLLRRGERLAERAFTALVMTSGNLSDEPLCTDNQEALERLGHIADAFVLHDRDILVGVDDSVVRDSAEGPIILRRARGFVPFPIRLHRELRPILAVGGNMKNTVCLSVGRNAFISQHLGDLEDASALEFFRRAAEHLVDIFQTQPEAIACDLHPDYLSTRHALAMARERDIPLLQAQHHHAHIVACMAEHGIDERVLGIACDGAGLGDDGTIWGCELLLSDYARYERIGHLRSVPLPGGDAAVRSPSRVAMAWLWQVYGDEADEIIGRLYTPDIADGWPLIRQMIERGLNCPVASSAGRLFDAVSSILGICQTATYEGQPAIMLEGAAEAVGNADLEFSSSVPGLTMDPAPLLRLIVQRRLEGESARTLAGLFHAGFAQMLRQAAVAACRAEGVDTVALSGGTFANRILVERLTAGLREDGLRVLLHRAVPPGDGCLSLGQAVVADAVLRDG